MLEKRLEKALTKMRHGRQVVRGSGENNEGLCERTGEGPGVD